MSTILFKGAELPKNQDEIKKYEADKKHLLAIYNIPLKSSLDGASSSSAQCQNTVLKIPDSSSIHTPLFSSFYLYRHHHFTAKRREKARKSG